MLYSSEVTYSSSNGTYSSSNGIYSSNYLQLYLLTVAMLLTALIAEMLFTAAVLLMYM